MNLIERVAHIQQVWRMIIPHLAEPAPADVGRWLEYSDRTIEAAILRTAGKFASSKIDAQTFDATRSWRYVSATAKQMAREVEEHSA
jgi:hypothetical protein